MCSEGHIIDIHTENLTILFVDIAGFTATTSRQSRQENADLLDTFDNTLLPLIHGFEGTLIKSIGDAMLLTFLSPTDAMLCSMAMQDAMHEHNLKVDSEDLCIHIRVAAHLGEVRLAKNDIFGEPVNLCSRIEGVAPADEIYLSEAVYMAMNKAEVPAVEVGFRELKGVPQAIRLYSIPRFSRHRLVPENIEGADEHSELLYPYGGMQYRVKHTDSPLQRLLPKRRTLDKVFRTALFASILLALPAAAIYFWPQGQSDLTITTTAKTTTSSPEPLPQTQAKAQAQAQIRQDFATLVEVEAAPTEKEKLNSAIPAPTLRLETENNLSSVEPTKPAEPAATTPNVTEPRQKSTQVKQSSIAASPATKSATSTRTTEQSPPTQTVAPQKEKEWSVTAAKQAYRDKEITKPEYSEIIRELKLTYKATIKQLKLDYRDEKITRDEYKLAVRKAKQDYKGGY